MEIAGYLASVLIGVALGLIGGGGSILTVPVLVYLFGLEAVPATAYSLFIVGVTSVAGSVSYFRKGLVDLRTAVLFGLPSVVAVYFTRALIIPSIPHELFSSGGLIISRDMALMLLFALLMLAASYGMIRRKGPGDAKAASGVKGKLRYPLILAEGSIVGVLTGLVGAGGGFLIIPALVLLSGLPMKRAVGTSLIIIAVKSLAGFTGEGGNTDISWPLLLAVTGFAVAGVFVGTRLARSIDGKKLQPAFGWFVAAMGLYILIRELIAG